MPGPSPSAAPEGRRARDPRCILGSMPWLRSVPLVLLLSSVGCPWGTDPDEDVEGDCQSCGSDAVFMLDPSCTLDGTLTVEIGQGPDSFTALADGEMPTVYQGFQGGEHMFFAVRIGNVSLERYDALQVHLALLDEATCPEGTSPCEVPMFTDRTLVLGGTMPLRVVDGAVEEYGIRTILEGAASVMQVDVLDPCGQVGVAQHRW